MLTLPASSSRCSTAAAAAARAELGWGALLLTKVSCQLSAWPPLLIITVLKVDELGPVRLLQDHALVAQLVGRQIPASTRPGVLFPEVAADRDRHPINLLQRDSSLSSCLRPRIAIDGL